MNSTNEAGIRVPPGGSRSQKAIKLVLHFGPGKTGSSAIQAWLLHNSVELRRWGIFYPTSASSTTLFSGNIQGLVDLLLQPLDDVAGNPILQPLTTMLQSYLAAAEDHNCHTIVLSSEHLPTARPDNMKILHQLVINFFEPCLVGFIRDPYWSMWSAWGQAVKRGGSYEDFYTYATEYISYYRHPSNQAPFGSIDLNGPWSSVKLLVYSENRLISDFARAVAIPQELVLDSSIDRVNRSLSRDELEALRAVNRVFRNADLSVAISDKMLATRSNVKAYRHFDPNLAATIRAIRQPVLDSLMHLVLNPEVPIIDNAPDAVESSWTEPAPGGLGLDLLHVILSQIEDWHERSANSTLRRMASMPAPEVNSDQLPPDFDSIDYLLLNPDVLAAGIDPVSHYVSFGRTEGRRFCRPKQARLPASSPGIDAPQTMPEDGLRLR